jgi:ATP adenylyltransferase
MKILWAPWRRKYVTAARTDEVGCVFCRAVAHPDDPERLVVHVTPLAIVVVNLYPYTSGHVMIAPQRHIARLSDATAEELTEMVSLAQRLEAILTEVYRPQGLNLGINLGEAAGAGIADHMHLHVLPRWRGDANFLSVVGQTRVIPEDPLDTCQKLRAHFAGPGARPPASP